MRAAVLALACGSVAAMPPITQEEAERFHKDGLCSIKEPGQGLTRADGDGWITSSLPGKHRLYVVAGTVTPTELDITPGLTKRVRVLPPGAPLEWCPAFHPPGRDACGPVPSAFLWDAKKVTDPRR